LLAEIEYRAKSAEGQAAASGVQGQAGGFVMNWGTALLWGAAVGAVLFAVLYVGYFAVQYFLEIPQP
jgi:hypothetical protein